MKMIANKPFRYGGKRLEVGEEFEATPSHAKLFKAIRRASEAPVSLPAADMPRAGPKYATAAIVADDRKRTVTDEAHSEWNDGAPVKTRRTYQRRDMVADRE